MNEPSQLPSARIPGLDGVRGLAILLVLLIHLGVMIPDSPIENVIFAFISTGWIGVDLFFVLSGALITGILLDTKKDPGYFRKFYIRRAVRIFPLYYAILIFSFYILPHFPHPKIDHFSRLNGDEIWYWPLLQNFVIGLHGPRHGIMDITWSLAIEEQFYLVWPLLVRVLPLRRLVQIGVVILMLSPALRAALLLAGVEPWAVYTLTPTRLDSLAAGALIAIALHSPSLERAALRRAANLTLSLGGGVTALVAATSGGLPWDGRGVQIIGMSALAAVFAGFVMRVILETGEDTLLQRAMRWRPLTELGAISYGLYLVQLPLRAVVRDTVMRPETFAAWPGGALVAQAVFYVVAGALAVSVAWLSYHGFERRILQLKGAIAPYRRDDAAFATDRRADVSAS